VKLLDKNGIQLTSVDLVRFRVESEDEGDLNYDDFAPIEPALDRTVYTTPVTIWVGVKPDSTTGEQAHHAAMDILRLLELHQVTDVEVAFRESEVKFLAGPELFAPVRGQDSLKDVIDNLSTALSLPIAGMNTLMQGTLGFYFRVRDDLYAVTARHVLFNLADPNVEYEYVGKFFSLRMMRGHSDYTYLAGPKKEVVVMGAPEFANYLIFLQNTIDIHCMTVKDLEDSVESLTVLVEGDDPCAVNSAAELPDVKQQLTKMQAKVEDYKAYLLKVKKEWSEPKDRVIGYIVWSPPISINTPPYSYTEDLCIIKLDKEKFRHFGGNILSLGASHVAKGMLSNCSYFRAGDLPHLLLQIDVRPL
jgi:hypothetical protein